jgi:uncharacterized protein (DUF2164 family)
MKTAMQELIDDIQKYIKVDWPMNKSIRNSINKALEKEKEQIVKAVEDTRGNIVPKMFISENLSGEQYYNQTYNQKQHIIDIMKADEDDGLYNQNK